MFNLENSSESLSVKFQRLSTDLSGLFNDGKNQLDRQQTNTLLDEINALDFKTEFVTSSQADVLIKQCCSGIPPNDTFLVAKFCQLISNIVTKQRVEVKGDTLSLVVNWIIESLKCCADIALLDIILALDVIVRDNGEHMSTHIDHLLGSDGILTSLLEPSKSNSLKLALPWEVHLSTLKCLESLTFKSTESKDEEINQPYLELCLQVFLKQFEQDKTAAQDEHNYCKIIITSMKGIKNVISQSPQLLLQLLGDLLGVVKAFMLHGIAGYSGRKPQRIFAAHLGQFEIRPTAGNAAGIGKGSKNLRTKKPRSSKLRKKSKNQIPVEDGKEAPNIRSGIVNNYRLYTSDDLVHETLADKPVSLQWFKTSESDFSDTEGGQAAKIRNNQGNVRQAALDLLLTIIKICERRVLFGYWTSLLPDGPNTPQSCTLVTCLLKDPSPRGRMTVLNVITALLLGSRLFLLQAEYSKKSSTSFTTFSITLGNMVRELHHSLCLALISENSIPVIMHILKSIAVLVQNTPYHRLEPGLIAKVIRNVRCFLKHKDSNVNVAALTVLGSIASVEPPSDEITHQLAKPARYKSQTASAVPQKSTTLSDLSDDVDTYSLQDDYDDSDSETESPGQISWLLEICLDNLADPMEGSKETRVRLQMSPTPVKIESLQVLAVFSRNFFLSILAPQMSLVVKTLLASLNNTDLVIHRHAGHVIEGIGHSLQQDFQNSSCKSIDLTTAVGFWQTILSGPVTAMIQNSADSTLRTVGCDCLASIGSDVFQQLQRDKQILIVTMLFGCCQDEDHNVRSSAVRALAMCILFPVLREDIHFVIDTAESVIRALQDESLGVRVKASWSLGNLSDALVLNSKAELEDAPDNMLLSLFEASISAAQDNDKVRSNAVRSIGNLLLLYTGDLMKKQQFREAVSKAISALVRNATNGNNMKVRWNACYAIGNMLKNEVLYIENSASLASVYSALTGLVHHFRNFKVRINAAAALAIPITREMYGSHYVTIWEALLNGLESSQNMEDFSEYKHQDTLVEQICLSLIHLITLATQHDLSLLMDFLLLHMETLQKQMRKFHERIVPEKAGSVIKASHHATSLLHLPGLTPDQRCAGAILVDLFNQETHSLYETSQDER